MGGRAHDAAAHAAFRKNVWDVLNFRVPIFWNVKVT
jgi:hypothetical protein